MQKLNQIHGNSQQLDFYTELTLRPPKFLRMFLSVALNDFFSAVDAQTAVLVSTSKVQTLLSIVASAATLPPSHDGVLQLPPQSHPLVAP